MLDEYGRGKLVTGNTYLHRFGLAKGSWAKLNNTVQTPPNGQRMNKQTYKTTY
jgi:hypothetical protein